MSVPTTDWLTQLLNIDSPTGFTENAVSYIEQSFFSMGYSVRRTRKGALVVSKHPEPKLCIAAHTDTLGFIVSGVNANGTLQISTLGSPLLPVFDGCYVRVYGRTGTVFTGTLLLNNPSAHANKNAATSERSISNMHVRLDEACSSADCVSALGIGTGCFIAVEPRVIVTQNGYIKSHFLDNKAGCAVLFELSGKLDLIAETFPVEFFFSTYEEVGHGGAAGYSDSVEELLIIDMGVVGDGCSGTETKVSICAKDSGGPYDYALTSTLIQIATKNSIDHVVDIYPFYSSDGTAAWRAGIDVPVALIGPGVSGSHGIERTHTQGISATADLCAAFIKHRFT